MRGSDNFLRFGSVVLQVLNWGPSSRCRFQGFCVNRTSWGAGPRCSMFLVIIKWTTQMYSLKFVHIILQYNILGHFHDLILWQVSLAVFSFDHDLTYELDFIRCHWLFVVCRLDACCSWYPCTTSTDISGGKGLHWDFCWNQTSNKSLYNYFHWLKFLEMF